MRYFVTNPGGPRPLAGWDKCQANERRMAAQEPEMAFRFPRGRARDSRQPGGIEFVSSFFILVGMGLGSLANSFGIPAEIAVGAAAEGIRAGATANLLLWMGAGALAGIAASAAFAVSWITEDQPGRMARLAWTFWGVCLAVMVLRVAMDAAAHGRGFSALLIEGAGAGTEGVLLCMAGAATAFLLGIAFHAAILPSKYDHDAFSGPIGSRADWRRGEQTIGFLLVAGFVALALAGLGLIG